MDVYLTREPITFSLPIVAMVVNLDPETHIQASLNAGATVDAIGSRMLCSSALFADVQRGVAVIERPRSIFSSIAGFGEVAVDADCAVDAGCRVCFFVVPGWHLCYTRIVPRRHCTLVPVGALEYSSRLLVEDLQ